MNQVFGTLEQDAPKSIEYAVRSWWGRALRLVGSDRDLDRGSGNQIGIVFPP